MRTEVVWDVCADWLKYVRRWHHVLVQAIPSTSSAIQSGDVIKHIRCAINLKQFEYMYSYVLYIQINFVVNPTWQSVVDLQLTPLT